MQLTRRNALKTFGTVAAASVLGAPTVLRAADSAVLTVSTWGGITEDSIRKYVQPAFEKLTGATLAFDIGGQGARYNKLLAQRANPPADVFFSTDEAVVTGTRAGVLTPATKKNLPNFADLQPWANTLKSDDDAHVGGVPYSLIACALAYNPELVKTAPTSWEDLWKPEFAGKIDFASPVNSLMPAFVIMAAELAGGSATNVDPGFAKLATLKPAKLSVFWTDWAPLNKTGDVVVATEFDYYLEAMKDQKYAIDYVYPKEKAIASLEYASVVKGTKKQDLAEAFLNLLLDPKVQEGVAEQTYQGPTNAKANLSEKIAARCAYGPRVQQLRFFDPVVFADNRPAWTERLNLEVVPSWGAR
jgi:putative spermidine/putrescine transport system substrate-binding protein